MNYKLRITVKMFCLFFAVSAMVLLVSCVSKKVYYLAKKTVVVKATFGENVATSDMSLSKQNVATVATILKSGTVLAEAGYPSGSLSVSYSETNSSQTLDLAFTSSVKGGAKEGLEKIVKAGQKVVAAENENGTSKYFSSNIKIELQPIGEGYVEWALSNEVSNEGRIKIVLLISGIALLVAIPVVMLILYFKIWSKKDRKIGSGYINIVTHILFSLFVPFWRLIWIYKVSAYIAFELKKECKPLKSALLCAFIPFYKIYWFYVSCKYTEKILGNQFSTGVFILYLFIPFLATIILQTQINEKFSQEKKPTLDEKFD